MASSLVVISHYNAWPTDQLVSLLDQVHRIPSGHPFRCLIVVNQAVDLPLELPSRFSGIEVLYRENTGYNIGAWDHGWRHAAPADDYLFLQEECRIVRPNWLGSFIREASKPDVGLVGESHSWPGLDWERIKFIAEGVAYEGNPDLSFYDGLRQFLESNGIPLGETGEHLQTLVLCTRREVLEAIGGFLIGKDKGDAISCEIAVSRAVAAKGLKIRQVGILPFRYILHPQWEHLNAGAFGLLRQRVYQHAPIPVIRISREMVHRIRKTITGYTYDIGAPGGR